MARIELKKCPFCGAEVDTVSVKEKDGNLNIEVKRKDRWIPCSERLPVLYVPVMILTDDGSYAIAHVTGNEDEYLWFGDGGHYSKDYVLFWMPLPEPPKEDDNE